MPSLEDEARELMARARDNQKHQLYDEALQDLLRAEELQPYDYTLQHWLGSIYLEHYDDPTTALTHFDRAVRYATPRSKKAGAAELRSRAGCKTALGDLEGAYDDTREALFLLPTAPPILYDHAARAAAIRREDEALSTLERAILGSPDYMLTAPRDAQFQVLGQSLHDMLDRMRDQVTHELESYVIQSRELEAAYSGWEILPRDLDAAKYDEMYSPLTEAQTALSLGDYAEQVKALESIRQALPAFADWIEQKLASAVSSAKHGIDYAHGSKSEAEDNAREYGGDILRALPDLLGPIVGVVAAVLLFLWGVHLLPVKDLFVLLLDLLKIAGVIVSLGIAYWAISEAVGPIKKIRRLMASRTQVLERTSSYVEEASEAEKKLRTLQAQQASYQKYLERARLN